MNSADRYNLQNLGLYLAK